MEALEDAAAASTVPAALPLFTLAADPGAPSRPDGDSATHESTSDAAPPPPAAAAGRLGSGTGSASSASAVRALQAGDRLVGVPEGYELVKVAPGLYELRLAAPAALEPAASAPAEAPPLMGAAAAPAPAPTPAAAARMLPASVLLQQKHQAMNAPWPEPVPIGAPPPDPVLNDIQAQLRIAPPGPMLHGASVFRASAVLGPGALAAAKANAAAAANSAAAAPPRRQAAPLKPGQKRASSQRFRWGAEIGAQRMAHGARRVGPKTGSCAHAPSLPLGAAL